jgi:hypothetical protein
MILGRPINLWLGFSTAVVGFVSVVAVSAFHADPIIVATVGGSATGLLGAGIGLVAGQPPTVNPGDTVHVTTPSGQPNYVTTIATPPAQDAPPVPEPQP